MLMAEEQVAGMSDVMQEDQSLLKFLSLLHSLRVSVKVFKRLNWKSALCPVAASTT